MNNIWQTVPQCRFIINNYSSRACWIWEEIAKEAFSAELAITISYPTRASGIIVLLRTPKELQYLSSRLFSLADAYTCLVANGI